MWAKLLSGWTKQQISVVVAAYLGWTLDAFDFFLMVFVLRDIAREFNTTIPAVAFAVVLTLALRPIGAFLFGRAADWYGRRPALIASILAYSVLAFASGFAGSLAMLLILRALFGIAMGGEWGVGASITMETIPERARGFVSGLLQCGYPSGYLLASVVYALLFASIGWRGMFMIGIVPALLAIFILRQVRESPQWQRVDARSGNGVRGLGAYARLLLYAGLLWLGINAYGNAPALTVLSVGLVLIAAIVLAARTPSLWVEAFAVLAMLMIDGFMQAGVLPVLMAIIYNAAAVLAGVFLKSHWRMGLYAVILMTAFNFFAHGTQDIYPTFLEIERGFSPAVVGAIAVLYNLGAIFGSLTFGQWSERTGRRRAIVIASLLSLPIVPLWAFGSSPAILGIAAFLMQFMVQGAWGIIPVHLNELSPGSARGTFPGFVYQLGNLLASVNATLQTNYAAAHGNDYGTALLVVASVSAVAIALLVGFGVERKGIALETTAHAGARHAAPDTTRSIASAIAGQGARRR